MAPAWWPESAPSTAVRTSPNDTEVGDDGNGWCVVTLAGDSWSSSATTSSNVPTTRSLVERWLAADDRTYDFPPSRRRPLSFLRVSSVALSCVGCDSLFPDRFRRIWTSGSLLLPAERSAEIYRRTVPERHADNTAICCRTAVSCLSISASSRRSRRLLD